MRLPLGKSAGALLQGGDAAGERRKARDFQALYRREREEAFEWAVTEALEHFSLCPICKRLVCDRCFLLGEDIDLCTDCAAFLQESGEPVESSFTKHG